MKGTNDHLPADWAAMRAVMRELEATFESFGYAGIDVPAIQSTDLYLRKAGGEQLAKMYSFVDQGGRRVSLRPEFTASVIRLFVEAGEALPLPIRWHYAGPVFRYERPQRGRYRQFTQQGAELIGASGPRADAEVVYLACLGLDRLGRRDYRVVLGHVGLALQLLDGLGLSERLKSFLLSSIEGLDKRSRGPAYVRRRLAELFHYLPVDPAAGMPVDPAAGMPVDPAAGMPVDLGLGSPGGASSAAPSDATADLAAERDQLATLLTGLSDEQARLIVNSFLRGMNLEFTGSRTPEEIAARFMRRFRQGDEGTQIERALDFVARLAEVAGTPPAVFDRARALLNAEQLDPAPLDELAETVALLAGYGVEPERLTIDFGLARGLAYYTGMVFEIYHGEPGDFAQLCGGGRYDGLVRALGGRRDVPALGFAYGVERLKESLPTHSEAAADVLVAPDGDGVFPYALRIAAALRTEGLRVEVDPRGRSRRANLEYARRRGIRRVVLVDPEDAIQGRYALREMATGEERHLALTVGG